MIRAMPLVSAVNIRLNYGADVILDGATIAIEAGERIGLVGRNGAGKSSLMKVIAGLARADSGDISIQRGCRAGYLTQDPTIDPEESLRDSAEGAFAELHRLHQEMHEVYEQMSGAEGEALDRLMRRQERLEAAAEAAGGYAIDHKIEETLHGLGFTDAQFAIRCRDLSGGQKGRLALARLLLESPDVLLLDEPTNHLDIEGRMWLEEFLVNEYRGAVLMVTHDRYMLDRVVSRIVEVEQGRIIDYPGNYRAFRKIRAERRLTQRRAFEKQQTKFRHEEEYIRRFKAGQRAKEAQGRLSKLERAKEAALEAPVELETFRLSLPKAPRSSDVVVSARGIAKAYTNVDHRSGEDVGEKTLFRPFDVVIGRGERWGIIGPNGAGKTTLVRCLLGELPLDEGDVRIGANVVVGHYRQTDEGMDPDRQVYRFLQDVIRKENPGGELTEQQARDLAGAFLFSGDEQEKRLGDLSGGEKSRARLAALLASAKNLLILDEPTNHLDIPSAERLEEALTTDPKEGGFEGTLILISHDRALIDAACNHLVVLDGHGRAEVFIGGWSDWRRREQGRAAERQQAIDGQKREQEGRDKKARAAAESQRQAQAAAKRSNPSRNGLERMSTEKLEQRIEEIEGRIRTLDAALIDPDVYRDARKAASLGDERQKLMTELEPLEFEWSRRAGEGGT